MIEISCSGPLPDWIMKLHHKGVRKPRSTNGFSPPAHTSPVIHVLSDSTGNLARHMLAALVTQFPPASISTQFHAFISSTERLDQVLDSIKAQPGAICHAVVSGAFKQRISVRGGSIFDGSHGAAQFRLAGNTAPMPSCERLNSA